MNRSIILGTAAAALALALASTASASCNERKATGTVIGGIGGALLGNSISRGGGGAIVGGLGGAVVGHEVAGAGCGRYQRSGYNDRGSSDGYQGGYDRNYRHRSSYHSRHVYYDERGNALPDGGSRPYESNGYAPGYNTASNRGGRCETVNRSVYDSRGNLTYQPVTTCR